ncbi:hypothetical protein K2Q00_01730 [Patescibacteria group bacterium]|nr:hypothetical protein [Patescibacteria group bacterium]
MSNKSVVVLTGNTGKKFFYGETEQADVTPFVGQDNMGQFGIGIAVTRPNGTKQGWIWGLVMPRHLIQSWRAMKLLEEMPRIKLPGTLSHCWSLAKEKLQGYDYKYLDEEGAVWGSYEKFREARAKVLAMFPTDDELKAMLAIVNEQGLNIRVEEIEEQREKLSSADGILKRLIVADDVWRERDRLEAESRAKRESERVKASDPASLPGRKGFFRQLFG